MTISTDAFDNLVMALADRRNKRYARELLGAYRARYDWLVIQTRQSTDVHPEADRFTIRESIIATPFRGRIPPPRHDVAGHKRMVVDLNRLTEDDVETIRGVLRD